MHTPLLKTLLTERGSQIFLGVLIATAILVPVLNLAVPADSALHVSTYTVTLLGK